MSLPSDKMYPDLRVVADGTVQWTHPLIPGLPTGSTKMTQCRYEQLKEWPTSTTLAEWIKEHNPNQKSIEWVIQLFNITLDAVAFANKYDSYYKPTKEEKGTQTEDNETHPVPSKKIKMEDFAEGIHLEHGLREKLVPPGFLPPYPIYNLNPYTVRAKHMNIATDAINLGSEDDLPEFMILDHGGLCWPKQKIPGMAPNMKMSRARYDQLKAWPTTDVFRAWVEEKKPHEHSLKNVLRWYGEKLQEIAKANNFDGMGDSGTSLAETHKEKSPDKKAEIKRKRVETPQLDGPSTEVRANAIGVVVSDAKFHIQETGPSGVRPKTRDDY